MICQHVQEDAQKILSAICPLRTHFTVARARPRPFRLSFGCRGAARSSLCLLFLVFFQPYSPSGFLVFALILFPESFGFKLVPVAFKIFESNSQSENDCSTTGRRLRLTQLPAGGAAPPL